MTSTTTSRTSTGARSLTAAVADVMRWQSDVIAGRRTGPVPHDEHGRPMSWDAALHYFGSDCLDGRPLTCRAQRAS